MRRTKFLTRTAYALALSLATVAAAGLVAVPAEAQKKDDKKAAPKGPQPTKGFIPAYNETKTALDAAAKRPDVIAAKAKVSEKDRAVRAASGRTAREAARAQHEAAIAELGALLTAEKAKVETALTKIGSDGDKFFGGQLTLDYGNLATDKVSQRRGIVAMIDSGHVPAEQLGRFNYFAGTLAYEAKDFVAAETALKAAVAAGNNSKETLVMLAEAQNSGGRTADALGTLKSLVDNAAAAGQVPDLEWLERGVVLSYQAKMLAESTDWAIRRVEFHPSQASWVAAGQLMRAAYDYNGGDSLDVSRALDRAGALNSSTQPVQREYVEYLQAVVGKVGVLYPGEAVKVANQGVKVTALQATDPFVRDALAEANRRVAADRASLPGLERDARAPAAQLRTVLIAADTLLSYEQADKAAELYQIALGKPGADASAINLRLGIALTKLGKAPEAEAAFGKVTGPRQSIARLWTLVAKGKVVPTT
jgi:predicted Zn-dependent protease